MSKPSRLPAIAGALAGLLAAGLGVMYFAPHGDKTPAPAPAASSQAPAQRLSRQQAMEHLLALPELKAWSAAIEKNSGGSHHGGVIEYDPAPRLIDGKPYYQLNFVENTPQAALTWQGFLVGTDGTILVEDEASEQPLTLARWRSEQQPMQRATPRPATP
jgi:hypothetical protein